MARGGDTALQSDPHTVGPRRIGLVVDHPIRDLDGLCLVAQMLVERGHEAVLMPFYSQHFDLPNLRLDAIVLNYARPANLALAEAAAARGIALCVLDTEGGLIPEDGPTSASGIARFLRRSGLDKRLALYLFWGQKLRDRVVAESALDPARAIVTGCPRFDLAHSPYEKPRQKGRGKVLVNTNFPVVNAARVQGYDSGGSIDAQALRDVGFGERDIADLAMNVRTVMQRMIETIRALAIARSARQFVVRPHPFERMEPYEAALTDLPNITVERSGTAMEALEAADCLLHVNCTTAIEACLVGVPPISLDFINAPLLSAMARLPGEISHRADGIAETLAMIDRAHKLPAAPAIDQILPFFGPLDGKAAQRVAEILGNAPLQSPGAQSAKPRRRLATLAGRVIGSSAIERARTLLEPSRAIKAFTASDVRSRIDRFAKAHGTKAANVEQSRSALGLPIMAVNVRPPRRDCCPADRGVAGVPRRSASD